LAEILVEIFRWHNLRVTKSVNKILVRPVAIGKCDPQVFDCRVEVELGLRCGGSSALFRINYDLESLEKREVLTTLLVEGYAAEPKEVLSQSLD